MCLLMLISKFHHKLEFVWKIGYEKQLLIKSTAVLSEEIETDIDIKLISE